MNESRHRSALRVCAYHSRGMLTTDEACRTDLFFCVEPTLVADYLGLLPDELRAAMAAFLRTLPDSDEGWAVSGGVGGVGQLGGDEWSWARTVSECRANTEAARAFLFGEASCPTAADFVNRVRAAYRERMRGFGRALASREPGQS